MIGIKTFLIIDGHSLAHRGYHALKARLTAPDGTPTAMIVGFINMLFKVQDDLKPDCTIIAFDAKGRTFRHELLEDYKANRKTLPDELRIQLPILQELLRLLGNNVIIREGVEADDVAASISRLVQSEGYEAVVLSSDKDLLQLLGTGIRMMRPIKNGISGAEVYDENSFIAEYGFMPSSMSDYLAIIGDSADNIKGIGGIGEKGARKILAQYPTLEDIYSSLDKLTKSQQDKFRSCGLEKVLWVRDNLIKLKDDIYYGDNDFLNQCLNFEPDFYGTEELALKLGLKRVLERIGSTKKVTSRKIERSEEFKMPECDIILEDYKASLKHNPELSSKNVWDLRTAYYLLHPDESAKTFPDLQAEIRNSDNPSQKLNELAGSLEAEICSYESLHDVMTDIDLPLIPVLIQMENHGIRVNYGKFSALQEELQERILSIEARIVELSGIRLNLNSPQQVSSLLFERMGFIPPEGTSRGKKSYSTEATVLEKLAKSPNGEIPALILEHRELTKMLTSFAVPFQRAGDIFGIIHTTFEPSVTGTGRLSSRDPNLQNIPAYGQWAEKIKAGLVPVNPENIFVSADYSQIELRVLAHLSQEERLIDAFSHNRDIHTETASWVFDVMPELVTPDLRRTAKMINFGLLYGMSSYGLSERLNVSRSEAKSIMDRYFSALPGLKSFLERIVSEAKAQGYTRTLSGRIRPVDEISAKGQALDRAIINTPIQGTAADIARRAMINYSLHGKGELFLQVHDSLVCECPESEADDVENSLREIMISSGGEVTHLEVETKRGKSLADV